MYIYVYIEGICVLYNRVAMSGVYISAHYYKHLLKGQMRSGFLYLMSHGRTRMPSQKDRNSGKTTNIVNIIITSIIYFVYSSFVAVASRYIMFILWP